MPHSIHTAAVCFSSNGAGVAVLSAFLCQSLWASVQRQFSFFDVDIKLCATILHCFTESSKHVVCCEGLQFPAVHCG